MLEIRRGIAARNYENSFFREFAKNLHEMFEKYDMDGLLIGNSECAVENRLQIDALLITKQVVCIIDFKNFEGQINLPRPSDFLYGRWTNSNNELIKGGSSINPYCQLKTQRKRFYDVFKNNIESNLPTSDIFNPGHTVRVVCFQKPIELIGNIPPEDEVNFKIIDQSNYLEKLKDILDVNDKEVHLSRTSHSSFSDIFEADLFDIKEKYNEAYNFQPEFNDLDFEGLRTDQKTALKEIDEFLKAENEQVFILQGTSQSGKTHLIPFIEKIAFDSGVSQVEILAPSSRIANNLIKDVDGVGSMYSHIYGGNQTSEHEDEESEDKDTKLDIVPLKKCDNETNAIFIVDESQLISDSYHQSLDLRFGSGYLLKDFIRFSNITGTSRKIIFIGDCYQISLGKTNENPLSPSYLKEQYDLNFKAFQLDDIQNGSIVLKNALKCPQSIRRNLFNSLRFDFESSFSELKKENVSPIIKQYLNSGREFKFLCYTNEESRKINLWIKKTIIGNGEKLCEGDLLMINNNVNVEEVDNPFAKPQKIYNGQFFTVLSMENISTEKVELKGGKSTELNFRAITVKLQNTNTTVSLLSLENYRNNLKAELSDEETIALKILLNKELKKLLLSKPFEGSSLYRSAVESDEFKQLEIDINELKSLLSSGEKVKTKLESAERKQRVIIRKHENRYKSELERELLKNPNSTYYKLKNVAFLRFGWALNVHKAMSYKWKTIIFNVDWNGGITNSTYFKWLYTGLTRALDEAFLINYESIFPIMNVEFLDNSSQKDSPKGYYLIADKEYNLSITDQENLSRLNMVEGDNKSLVAQLYKLVEMKLNGSDFKIRAIEHPNYQQVYELIKESDKVKIRFYYDGKLRVKMPSIQSGTNENVSYEALTLITQNSSITDFGFISDTWRAELYSELTKSLAKESLFIKNVVQNSFKDVMFISDKDELQLEIILNYNGDGFFSSIVAQFCANNTIWDDFVSIFKQIPNGE